MAHFYEACQRAAWTSRPERSPGSLAGRDQPAPRNPPVYRDGDDASYREERLRPEMLARTFGLPVDAYPIEQRRPPR